ncbi:hypothetical protein FRC11_000163 [Ceratobasidium sp. 423]|nr:hypothetical protein FRC11_000163 [Ceratobasidium sp. 423]
MRRWLGTCRGPFKSSGQGLLNALLRVAKRPMQRRRRSDAMLVTSMKGPSNIRRERVQDMVVDEVKGGKEAGQQPHAGPSTLRPQSSSGPKTPEASAVHTSVPAELAGASKPPAKTGTLLRSPTSAERAAHLVNTARESRAPPSPTSPSPSIQRPPPDADPGYVSITICPSPA